VPGEELVELVEHLFVEGDVDRIEGTLENGPMVRGPMIGPVTAGRVSSHARATVEGSCPISPHRSSYRSSWGRCVSMDWAARPW